MAFWVDAVVKKCLDCTRKLGLKIIFRIAHYSIWHQNVTTSKFQKVNSYLDCSHFLKLDQTLIFLWAEMSSNAYLIDFLENV